MSRVSDLLPGDEVTLAGESGVFVASTAHPIWPGLELVVWRLKDRWSHDALLSHQEVGDVTPSDPQARQARLRGALLGKANR